VSKENGAREIIQYEYQFYSTPRYIGEPVSEFWEIHKVFHSWLDNGNSHTFIVVLRRPYEKKETPDA
jgi:hypothetical protein